MWKEGEVGMRPIDADALMDYCNNQKDKTIDANDIARFPTIGGWISVKDGLPEKNQIVIASDGEHTWDVGMYKSFCGKPSEWNWKKNTVKTVLWWMPKDGALPEPLKEGK
jgi:hypothetical protein